MIGLRIHDRFIAISVGRAVLLTWLVLTVFSLIGAMLDQIDDFGRGDFGLPQALQFVALQIPRRLYENFPMAAVIGSVLALGGHAARSELVAMRAAGLSPLRIGATALGLVIVLALPTMALVEWVVPGFEQRAQALKLQATQREVALGGGGTVWAREGDEVFQARGGQRRLVEGRPLLVFEQVRVYAFDAEGRLAWLQEADEAEYHEDRGWVLREVRRTVFESRSARVEHFPEQIWETALRPGIIESSLIRPRHLPTAVLAQQIRQLERNGLDASVVIETYWGRWFYLLTALALVFAALPFAFGQRRSGGFGQRLLIGIVLALVARLLQPMLVDLAQVYAAPVALAYLLPVLGLLVVGGWWLRKAG